MMRTRSLIAVGLIIAASPALAANGIDTPEASPCDQGWGWFTIKNDAVGDPRAVVSQRRDSSSVRRWDPTTKWIAPPERTTSESDLCSRREASRTRDRR